MSLNHEVLKQRLSGLTATQRQLLVHRLGVETKRAEAGVAITAPIRKEAPRRIEVNAEGRQVAVYPASNGQQRMWFLHHFTPDSPVYSTPIAFQLRGPLQVSLLEAAFQRIIDRHESLRTTFAMEDGELVQHVASSSAFRLDCIPTTSAAAALYLEKAACLPFNLRRTLPFRVVLASVGPDEHLLLLVTHHIISDGWSHSNLCRELSNIYAALTAGLSPTLPGLPVQFVDYAAWHRRLLEGATVECQSAYWKRKLAGEPEPLDLPADRRRPVTETFRGEECSVQIDGKLLARLKQTASENTATLFMVLLAAFKILLHRLTGQQDLLVGVPIANRQRSEVEALIGHFINTVVMRTMISREATFEEVLGRVKETALEAYEHQDLPFESLVNLLPRRRDAGRTPLFEACFALRDFPEISLTLPGLEVSPFPVSTHTSKFDLSLTVRPNVQGLLATMEYSSELFDADRVRRMLELWQMVLADVAASPTRRVSEIPLLATAEKHRVLVEWNDTARDFPREKCLHKLIDEMAMRAPDAVAVKCETEELTYRELQQRSNQLAHDLHERGVKPETRVGVCMERSVQMLVAMLAILKAGGAYVPLDPRFPPSRLALILEDAEAPLLLTQRSLLACSPDYAGERIFLDEWKPGQENTKPGVNVSPATAAYIIYTSGSTGRPKGVVIEHESVVNLLHSVQTELGIQARDILLAVTTISFDISVLELFLPLIIGARVVIVPDNLRADGPGLAALMEASGATIFQSTPSTWKLLIHAGWTGSKSLKALTGGEALPPDLATQLLDRGAELWNLYGPTETTIWSLFSRVKKGDEITIGKPLANTVVYVVDGHGKPTPIGVPGELWIGGTGVARGYHHRDALTAERFLPDPFLPTKGARIYRTGDRVRWRADGTLEFLGRIDTQVKLRGFRIELGEVEAALRESPGVREAVVAIRDAPDGETRLVAYVARAAGTACDGRSLQTALKARLPDYMVPAHIEFLSSLPVTPNGKVDRRALPEPVCATSARGLQSGAPRDMLELNLARIWQRLFQRDAISRDDNFFDLGGNSFMAARLVVEIEKFVGRKVPISALFQAQTITTLARLLVEKAWAPTFTSLVPLQTAGQKTPLFCAHGWGGDLYVFLDLTRELAPDRPVFGLQAVGLSGNSARHLTVEEMAAHYVREIRSLRPNGPYHILGYSAGGWIAYAIAIELNRQGQQVSLLAMLETHAASPRFPSYFYPWVKIPPWVRLNLKRVKKMTGIPKGNLFRYFRRRWRAVRGRRPGQHPDYFVEVCSSYHPEKYRGNLDLFVTGNTWSWHWWFWKFLIIGRVRVHKTVGDHTTLIDQKHAKAFAPKLNEVLSRIEAKAVGAVR